ncbi:hypothetical protein Tco_1081323 [Tanacetum coccineum]|uniref:Retrotransposon gag domain-containing protein n=1 Tax=Tanacetum coccineum TaxID=301880 RepID=A0ABQ5HXC8_9ASTR
MGDKNPIHTLRDYSRPSHGGYRNTIELPDGNNVVPLQSDTIRERTRLRLFQFSLHDQASNWLERLPAGSISTWDDLITCESLSKAWTHLKDLLQKDPHHGIDLWLQVQIFYDHVNPAIRRTVDRLSGGKLGDKNAKESWELLEASPSMTTKVGMTQKTLLNRSRKSLCLKMSRVHLTVNQVQHLMEAYLAHKSPVQVNKIASSCEICIGPHDTQCCMENPGQAFVDYASSCNNEVGNTKESEESKEEVEEELEEEKEEDDDLEYFDTFPTIEELGYHEWLLKNP